MKIVRHATSSKKQCWQLEPRQEVERGLSSGSL
jgi:hypothetical protein